MWILDKVAETESTMEQIDTRKLCLMALDANETDEHIREMCERFGQLQSFNRPSNKKELAFALYNNER